MLPVVMALILLLLQPGIVLYDRIVMQSAAAEGCRLLATLPSDSVGRCEQFVRHRLAAIPQQDLFHVHQEACSYQIDMQGSEASATVSVSISNNLRPLPLIGFGASLLGVCNDEGLLTVRVDSHVETQPSWTWSSPAGGNPHRWVGAWL